MSDVFALVVGYLVGSLPIGFALATRMTGVDLRRVGSGNVGAANVYRTAGLALAVLVVTIDAAKGAGSVLLAARLAPGATAPVTAGVAAIIGHVYPVWLRFRGGKGVATACGAFLVLTPVATFVAASVFVVTVWVTRYVSLGSVIATAALPALAWVSDAPMPVIAGGVTAAVLIIERHKSNLSRVQAGTERRLGQKA